MNWHQISLRGLQLYCVVSALIAVVGGGSFVILGSGALTYFSQGGVSTLADLNATTLAWVDIWYRTLGCYWLSTGLILAWLTPTVQTQTAIFRLTHIGFIGAGVATTFALSEGSQVRSIVALLPELGIPALAILWQLALATRQNRDED